MNFFALRWEAYASSGTTAGSRKILCWDIGRALVWMVFFAVGLLAHDMLAAAEPSKPMRFMIAAATFGTFLASFVLSVMTTTGKRELDLMPDANSVRQMKERLRWLMSDQLIMVVSALLTASFALVWLGVAAAGFEPFPCVTASALAFAALAVLNALRLPFQMWELQSSALEDEQKRAIDRIKRMTEQMFRDQEQP